MDPLAQQPVRASVGMARGPSSYVLHKGGSGDRVHVQYNDKVVQGRSLIHVGDRTGRSGGWSSVKPKEPGGKLNGRSDPAVPIEGLRVRPGYTHTYGKLRVRRAKRHPRTAPHSSVFTVPP